MKTIRDLVEERRVEVGGNDLQPHRARELLRELSALLGNVLAEIRKCDMAYNQILVKSYGAEEKANRAKIIAETSGEYMAMREARDLKVLVLELIRSLKYQLRGFEEEAREGGQQ